MAVVRDMLGTPRVSRATGVVAAVPALLGLLMLGSAARAGMVQVQLQDAASKPLADAVVFLESPQARAAVRPLQGAEIAQANKQFEPRVTVIPLGSSVQFPNRDTVRHHVYSFSPVKNFELKLYAGVAANPVLFDRSGIAVLGCNIHDNMAAWVVVVDTPYYGRSADTGRLMLANVPPGTYRLRSWHPALPMGAAALDQALVVGAEPVSVTLKIPVTP